MLDQIFEKQKELNVKIIPSLYEDIKDPEEFRKWALNFLLAMQQESSEAVNSLNWKWWKKDNDDLDNFKVELIDILHFWVSLCTLVGLTPNDVVDLYFKKHNLNVKRQDEGYKDGTYEKFKNGVEDNSVLFVKPENYTEIPLNEIPRPIREFRGIPKIV